MFFFQLCCLVFFFRFEFVFDLSCFECCLPSLFYGAFFDSVLVLVGLFM